jgi:hypothetical protein
MAAIGTWTNKSAALNHHPNGVMCLPNASLLHGPFWGPVSLHLCQPTARNHQALLYPRLSRTRSRFRRLRLHMLASVLSSGHTAEGKVRDALSPRSFHQSLDANLFRCQVPVREVKPLPEVPP